MLKKKSSLETSFSEKLETKSIFGTFPYCKILATRIDSDELNMYNILEIPIMNTDILINNTVEGSLYD